jgi:hypothetical protein
MAKIMKKAQRGIMDTKLKDVPGKVKKAATNVKDAVSAGFNKTVDKVKNTTVGDALKFVANPSYSAAESAVKSLNRSKLAKKAQNGDLISKYGLKPKNLNDRQLNRVSKISEKNVERSKKVADRISERRNTRGAESAKNPLYFKNGGKEMIKRADGSYSKRGLWDNIRANKGSGKKPTAAMLKQEKKIKAKTKK